MRRNVIGKILSLILAIAVVLLAPIRPLAHESPVDHVDRSIRIWIDGETIFLCYKLQLSERAAMMQLKDMDTDADGVVSNRERDAYFAAFSANLAKQLRVQIDERALELKPSGKAELLPQFR